MGFLGKLIKAFLHFIPKNLLSVFDDFSKVLQIFQLPLNLKHHQIWHKFGPNLKKIFVQLTITQFFQGIFKTPNVGSRFHCLSLIHLIYAAVNRY